MTRVLGFDTVCWVEGRRVLMLSGVVFLTGGCVLLWGDGLGFRVLPPPPAPQKPCYIAQGLGFVGVEGQAPVGPMQYVAAWGSRVCAFQVEVWPPAACNVCTYVGQQGLAVALLEWAADAITCRALGLAYVAYIV